jgi:hypothetical protein
MYHGTVRHVVLGMAIALSTLAAPRAGEIEISWDPVPGATGYRVYRGTATGQYQSWQDVGQRTRVAIAGLDDCRTWYLAVRAYAANGALSDFSEEVAGWPRPEARGVYPRTVRQGEDVVLEIRGANFKAGAEVSLQVSPDPTDSDGKPLARFGPVSVVSCTRLELSIDLEPAARGFRAMPVGPVSLAVEVVNPDSVFGSGVATFDVALDPARLDINRSTVTTRDRVDGADLAWLAFAYGTLDGESRYNPDADLDGNGVVDGDDLALLAAGFGRCWAGSRWLEGEC